MKKNGFLTFVTACIPGAGQMYQCYMKRGLSLMGLFFGTIAIGWLFHIGGIAVVLPVVWAYAFFDTFHIHNRTPEQLEQVPDDYLFHLSSLGSGNLHALYEQRHTLLGLSLILVACLLLYNSVVLPLLWDFVPSVVYELFSYVPEIILAVLLILLGLWLLRGPRAPRSEEDYTAYTGAPSAAQPQEMSSEAPQTVEAASSEENRHAE